MKINLKMRVANYLLLTLMIIPMVWVNAQEELEYRRSSLTMVLIEDDELGENKDLVIESYESNPFPDKYNYHKINDKKFDPGSMKLSTEDYIEAGFYVDTLRTPKDFLLAKKKPLNPIRYLSEDNSEAVLEPSKNELLQIYIDKYIKEKDLAKQVVSTWFNRKDDGTMDFSVIQERGKYSASAEKLDDAKTAALATDFLMDWDLISNTYTIFNKMVFYPNEPYAASIRDEAIAVAEEELAGKPEVIVKKTMEKIEQVYEKTKEGYTVKCNSFLYQLDWDEEVANKTRAYFIDNDEIDRKTAWDTTNLYNMKFVGKITTGSVVTFKVGETRSEEEIIDLQIRRTMDNALAKLQKKYIQFRPVSPISSVKPLTARIGMKEGVKHKQKFEVLEMVFDETGIPSYKKIGKVKVDKNLPVWDNRQGAEQEPLLDDEGNPIETPEYTTFKGGKKAQVGLHYIRLIK